MCGFGEDVGDGDEECGWEPGGDFWAILVFMLGEEISLRRVASSSFGGASFEMRRDSTCRRGVRRSFSISSSAEMGM